MSTMETPPPPPDARRRPWRRRSAAARAVGARWRPIRSGACACGAAAGTEVVETRGWRVPLYLGGGLVALAVIGRDPGDRRRCRTRRSRRGNGTPTPAASAAPPGATPSPLPTITPIPATPTPGVTRRSRPRRRPRPVADGDGHAGAVADRAPRRRTRARLDVRRLDRQRRRLHDHHRVRATAQPSAEKVAQEAQDAGLTVGILNSDDYSSLNGGYQVVFTGDVRDASPTPRRDSGRRAGRVLATRTSARSRP